MKINDAVALVAARLQAAGIDEPRREARIILAAALGVDAAGLLARDDIEPLLFEPLVARRERREPLALILGRQEFWGLEFATSPATLVPRHDSETLIEAATELLEHIPAVKHILDLGTGTGCLLLAALYEFTEATGIGVDVSAKAANLARHNAQRLGLGHRAMFIAGNWADAINQRFELILSNPPYINSADIAGLMPEVREFEPGTALDGGADGLDAYRAIMAALPRLLAPKGIAVLELGAGQFAAVAALAGAAGFATLGRADLAGHIRALVLGRK